MSSPIVRLLVLALSTLLVGAVASERAGATPTLLLQWGTPGNGNGELMNPVGVALDPNGNVYVAERLNQRIQKFTSNGTYITKWGSAGSGNGEFSGPSSVTVDADFNVYVVDELNDRVQKFDSTGTYLTQWNSADGSSTQFAEPWGIAVDADRNVYVADRQLHSVHKYDEDGTFLLKWGSYGVGIGQLRYPTGVAVDTYGHVYVTDNNNNRVQVFTGDGAYLRGWGSFGSGNGQFNYPYGLEIGTDGSVYVADHTNYRVQEFTSGGNYLTQFGSHGSGPGQFNGPVDVALDAAGHIYVADEYNHRIQKFSPGEPGCWGAIVVADPQDQAVEAGSSTSLSVSADGTATLTYQWQKYCADIGGATSSTYAIASAGPGDAGPYRVIVSNTCGADTSAAASLVVATPTGNCATSGWIANGRPMHSTLNSELYPWHAIFAGVTDGERGVIGTWSYGDARVFGVDSCGQVSAGWSPQGEPLGQHTAHEVAIVSDATGGAIVAYIADGSAQLIAQRVTHAGTLHPSWPANGTPIASNPLYDALAMAPADSSGAYVYYHDLAGVPRLQRMTGSGTLAPGWPAGGIALSGSYAGTDYRARQRNLAADGTGGVYAAWRNYSDDSIRVQRVTAQGQLAAGWPAGGRGVGVGDGYGEPQLVLDGAGGVHVVWPSGTMITAQRLTASGAIAAGWLEAGRIIGTGGAGDAASDGVGGLLVTWHCGPTTLDICASRVPATASSCALDWPAAGTLVCGTPADQFHPAILGDGEGGAYVAWEDLRNSSDGDIYVHHVTAWGSLDSSWPAEGRLLCGGWGRQLNPTFVGSGAADAIVLWQDYRNGTYDDGQYVYSGQVFGQRPWIEGNLPVLAVDRVTAGSLSLTRTRPNPASSRASFDLQLSRAQSVNVTVSDIAGRSVRILASGDRLAAGPHVLEWDLRDATGAHVRSGLYFIRARSEAGSVVTRLIVVR